MSCLLFFFNDTATTEIYTLSLHDALPISLTSSSRRRWFPGSAHRSSSPRRWSTACVRAQSSWTLRPSRAETAPSRSEEHTSELQSPCNLVCRLLLEKKKKSYHIFPLYTDT